MKKRNFFFLLVVTDEDDHDDGDEIHMKTVPLDPFLSTRSTNMSNSIELQKLTSSVETMRASVLQAYVSVVYRSKKVFNSI